MATTEEVRRELIAASSGAGMKMKEPEPRVEVEARLVGHTETRLALHAGKRKAGADIYVLAASREHEGTARFLGWATKAEAAPVKDVGGMGSRATSSTAHACVRWQCCWVSGRPRQPRAPMVA